MSRAGFVGKLRHAEWDSICEEIDMDYVRVHIVITTGYPVWSGLTHLALEKLPSHDDKMCESTFRTLSLSICEESVVYFNGGNELLTKL